MSKSLTNNALNTLLDAAWSNDLSKSKQVLTKARNTLLNDISTSDNFFIDTENSQKIQTIFERIVAQHNSINEKISKLKTQKSKLESEETSLTGRADPKSVDRLSKIVTEKSEIDNEVRTLNNILTRHISNRKTEYQNLVDIAEKFILDANDVSVSRPVYNIWSSFMQLGEAATEYKLFSSKWEEISARNFPMPGWRTVNWYAVKVTQKDGKIVDAVAQDIVLDVSWNLDLSSLRLYDPSGSLITLKDISLELFIWAKVRIWATITPIKYLTNVKKILYTPKDIIAHGTALEGLYDTINTSSGIDGQLTHIHSIKYEKIKKEVIFKLLEENNKSQFEKLNDKQKDVLFERINGILWWYNIDDVAFHAEFKKETTKEDFLGTNSEFEQLLLQNFDTKWGDVLKKILEDRLDQNNIGTPAQKAKTVIVWEFMNFLTTTWDMNITTRHSTLWIIEWNLSAEYLETRLRQDYENKFNKLQRESFEKVLADNPEFAKLNQAQKDRLYERMQDLGTIANPVKPISLGTDAAGGDTSYSVNDITFAPSTHDYSVMPHGEDYNGFKVWLANQAPKDIINDEEKYRQWLRNGLAASLDNGKTHYESFFDDVLKQFTDDLNVKTTLNKTLLDFINDTNEADHVWFEADLAATLNATEPLTTHTKKRYQKLAFWTRGEPQNYLSFFSGQSHEFKNESITAGGKTFGYTGKLDIHGAQSMSMSLKMKEGQEQIYTGGNPVALVRTLLKSPDIEPPHARFHAGLSVVKSVTKIARENGISLRTALTPEMLGTLPISIRTTLENGENPMVEIEEENGKLVAKVFNLNLTTRRKENEYKMFDEQDFVATQSVRDLRQGVEWLLALTNQTMNSVYSQYREARFSSGLRPGLLHKPRYGGLRNGYKKLSFTGESISVGGKSFTLDCKDGLFTFSGWELKKPVKGRNLGDLLAYNPALRGVELRAIRVANEKMLAMYQEKLKKQERHHNYGVIDEENHRVYIYDKNGNLGYYESNDQTFVQRWRQYTSGHRYGRIADENMPTGFRVMKKWDSVVDSESYENFLRNETVVWSMVRAMSRTHRALIAMDPR